MSTPLNREGHRHNSRAAVPNCINCGKTYLFRYCCGLLTTSRKIFGIAIYNVTTKALRGVCDQPDSGRLANCERSKRRNEITREALCQE